MLALSDCCTGPNSVHTDTVSAGGKGRGHSHRCCGWTRVWIVFTEFKEFKPSYFNMLGRPFDRHAQSLNILWCSWVLPAAHIQVGFFFFFFFTKVQKGLMMLQRQIKVQRGATTRWTKQRHHSGYPKTINLTSHRPFVLVCYFPTRTSVTLDRSYLT